MTAEFSFISLDNSRNYCKKYCNEYFTTFDIQYCQRYYNTFFTKYCHCLPQYFLLVLLTS